MNVVLEYRLEREEPARLVITELSGKPVLNLQLEGQEDMKVLDTRKWKPGIYIATLKVNQGTLDSRKFSVTH